MIYLITGPPGGGTTFIADYLDGLQCNILGKFDVHHEDTRYFSLITNVSEYNNTFYQKWNYCDELPYEFKFTPSSLSLLSRYISDDMNVYNTWGIKTPLLGFTLDTFIPIINENDERVNITVVHVIRNLYDTCQSHARKPGGTDNKKWILLFHKEAIRAYNNWRHRVKFIFVDVYGVMQYPKEFYALISPPGPYVPVSQFMKGFVKNNIEIEDEIYTELERLKWNPLMYSKNQHT